MFIKEKNVFLNLKQNNKYEILKEMIFQSTVEESLKDCAYKKVKEREELQSTSVGNGVGVAHAKFEDMKSIELLVCILKEGIDYEAYDEKPVNIIFVILAPLTEKRNYLKLLSKISRICRNENLVNDIVENEDTDKLIESFREIGD